MSWSYKYLAVEFGAKATSVIHGGAESKRKLESQ